MAALGDALLRSLIERGLAIQGLIAPELQIQPAGVELTLAKIFRLKGAGCVDLTNERRRVPEGEEIPFNEGGYVDLGPGAYRVLFNEIVRVPPDCIAIGLPRSTLIRSGATVLTALWDPGYVGRSQALLVVFNEHGIRLYKNARLLQLVFIKVEGCTRTYSGAYQGEGLGEARGASMR